MSTRPPAGENGVGKEKLQLRCKVYSKWRLGSSVMEQVKRSLNVPAMVFLSFSVQYKSSSTFTI